MHVRSLLTLLAACGVLATARPAVAGVPRHLTAQGQLADSLGAPIEGNVLMTFTIYDSALATAHALWSETQSVTVRGGRFAATLGAAVPIDPTLLVDAVDAHLGIAVAPDGEMGRAPLAAAAYAFFAERADDAALLDGLPASAFARAGASCGPGQQMNGVLADGAPSCEADRDSTYSGVDFALSGQSCPADTLLLGVDAAGALVCVADQDTTYSGTTFARAALTCPAGQHLRGIDAAGAPICGADANTTYSGTTFAPSAQACTAPLVARGFDATGALLCVADANTTYSGAHFATSGQSCAAGQLARGFGATGQLVCVADADTNTTYSGANFATSNQTCAASQVATSVSSAGALGCTSTSAWDTNAANDLTASTAFGGALTGTYGALTLPDASITGAQLSQSYVVATGDSVTGPVYATAAGLGVELGHAGGIDFGMGCMHAHSYPTDWEHVNTTTDGFCITTGQDPAVANDETLFITAQDNGAAAEAIYFGSAFGWAHDPPTTSSVCWRGMRVQANGNAQLYGALTSAQGALYADLAENVPVAGSYEVGDVLAVDHIDRDRFGASRFLRAATPYDRDVVGVVSDTAALAMGPAEGRAPVALAGLVKVKVDATYGAIHRGDVLVASATPGHAMAAAKDVPGAGLGKALEDLDRGRGLIMMMVAPR